MAGAIDTELIPAPQNADELPAISKDKHQLLYCPPNDSPRVSHRVPGTYCSVQEPAYS